MDVWPSAPVINIVREQLQKGEGHFISLHEPILPTTTSEKSMEGKDKVCLERKCPTLKTINRTERLKQGTSNRNAHRLET